MNHQWPLRCNEVFAYLVRLVRNLSDVTYLRNLRRDSPNFRETRIEIQFSPSYERRVSHRLSVSSFDDENFFGR